MLKKRYANGVNNGNIQYFQQRLDQDYFKGYVCLAKIKDVQSPFVVSDGDYTACIMDEGYEWLQVYPDGKKYIMTAMFDKNKRLIEWYFDMIMSSGLECGVPYMYDLYLDLVITPQGKHIVLDQDELQMAKDTKVISKPDYDMAYATLQEVEKVYNLKYIKNLTKKLYSVFSKDKISF